MKKIISLALVCTGFVVTMPFTAQALGSEKISPNLDREPNVEIAQYDRDQDRDNQDRHRDNQDRHRDNQDRRYQSRDRLFIVYYRSSDDRRWMYVSKHWNRRDAQRAANQLERRGYRTQIL